MKNIFLLSIMTIFNIGLIAQNLIQNPSFEDYSQCPPDIGLGFNTYISYANTWDFSSPSPDFFHLCGEEGATIPENFFGRQLPATGDGYIGISIYQTSFGVENGREGIITQLTDTLEIGEIYYCSFKISLAEQSPWACNNIGMLFTTYFHQIPFSTQTIFNQPDYAQILSDSIISDTANWITVSGNFVADSNYTYLSISNFFNDINTEAITANPDGLYGVAYYYLDDICVSSTASDCGLIASVQNTQQGELDPKIFPNPSFDLVNIDFEKQEKKINIEVYDLTGRLKMNESYENQKLLTIDFHNFPKGLYLIKMKTDSKIFSKKVVIK